MSDYEKYIDCVINSHRNKLHQMNSNKSCISNKTNRSYFKDDYNSTNAGMYNTSFTFEENSNPKHHINHTYEHPEENNNFNSKTDQFKNLKMKKMEKIIENYTSENSNLKLKIQDLENHIKYLTSGQLGFHQDVKMHTNLYQEREKDLLETLNLCEFEIKRLEEKVTNLENENRSKDRQIKLLMSDKDSAKDTNHNFTNGSFSTREDNKLNFSEELNLRLLKFEKVVNMFSSFFSKFENFSKITLFTKTFDFDNLKLKLVEFEMYINSLSNQNIDKNTISCFGSPINNSSTILKTPEQEIYSKLDSRLKELEFNFNSFNISKNNSTSKSNVKTPATKIKSNIMRPASTTSFKTVSAKKK